MAFGAFTFDVGARPRARIRINQNRALSGGTPEHRRLIELGCHLLLALAMALAARRRLSLLPHQCHRHDLLCPSATHPKPAIPRRSLIVGAVRAGREFRFWCTNSTDELGGFYPAVYPLGVLESRDGGVTLMFPDDIVKSRHQPDVVGRVCCVESENEGEGMRPS